MEGGRFEEVLISADGGVATITLNRPERHNALGGRLVRELGEALDGIENSAGTRVLILTGAGERAFCSGADLKERAGMNPDERWTHNRAINRFADRLASLQIPTIAAINGLAFGGGLEITLPCDFRLAAQGATFALPETSLGIVPGAGGTQRLPRLIGLTRAKELILTARRIDAEKALEMDLVSRVVPQESLMDEALGWAREISANSPLALAYAKAAIDLEATLEEGLRFETDAIKTTLQSEDYRIGLEAFADKRKPQFPPLTARDAT